MRLFNFCICHQFIRKISGLIENFNYLLPKYEACIEPLSFNSVITLVFTKVMATDTEIFRKKEEIISPSKSKCFQLPF